MLPADGINEVESIADLPRRERQRPEAVDADEDGDSRWKHEAPACQSTWQGDFFV
ncbi:MAG: hypothetical protein V2A77_06530 [Pseudomonadota bacterium]